MTLHAVPPSVTATATLPTIAPAPLELPSVSADESEVPDSDSDPNPDPDNRDAGNIGHNHPSSSTLFSLSTAASISASDSGSDADDERPLAPHKPRRPLTTRTRPCPTSADASPCKQSEVLDLRAVEDGRTARRRWIHLLLYRRITEVGLVTVIASIVCVGNGVAAAIAARQTGMCSLFLLSFCF